MTGAAAEGDAAAEAAAGGQEASSGAGQELPQKAPDRLAVLETIGRLERAAFCKTEEESRNDE